MKWRNAVMSVMSDEAPLRGQVFVTYQSGKLRFGVRKMVRYIY